MRFYLYKLFISPIFIIICFNTLQLKSQNTTNTEYLLPAFASSSKGKVDIEIELKSIFTEHLLKAKPQAGDYIYFWGADGSDGQGNGGGISLNVNWQFKDRWRLGFMLFLISGVDKRCEEEDLFWNATHGIDLADTNSIYFLKEYTKCEQEILYNSNENSYSFNRLGVFLKRIVPLGRKKRWTFEPALGIGVNRMKTTEPYIVLKEKNSNNIRTIAYIGENQTAIFPNVALAGKFRWRIGKSIGFTTGFQYSYMWGKFDYQVEDKQLIGESISSHRAFRQIFETSEFNVGVYFPL